MEKDKEERALLCGSISQGLIRMALPLIAGNIVQQFYQIADSLVIGKYLGMEAFAAVGIAGTVMTMMIFLLSGGCSGLTTVFSMLYGKGDDTGFRQEFFITTVFGGIAAVFVSIFCMAELPVILYLIQTPENLFGDVLIYLRIIAAGMPGMYYYNLFSSILRSLGNTRASLWVLLFSAGMNIVLDIWLIAGCSMGIAGAACGTVISQVFSAAGCFYYLCRNYPKLVFGWKDRGFHWKLLQKSCIFAFSSSVSMAALYIGKMMIQGSVNALGTSGIAAFASASRLEGFTNTFSTSCGAAIHIIVSQNAGAGNWDRVRETLKKGMRLNMIITLGTAWIIAFWAKQGMEIFLDAENTEAILQGEQYLRIVAAGYVFCVMGDSMGGYLRGIGRIFAPVAATFLNILPRVILAPYFTRHWGLPGLGYATEISWVLLAAGMFADVCYTRKYFNHRR